MIYTIGHSTRTQEELIELLRHYGVSLVLDIRIIPMSRYNPQFNRDVIPAALGSAGIGYEHCPALGGIKPSAEVMRAATSCSERSRGFGEFMKTAVFAGGLDHAIVLSQQHTIALMCAESDPSHCHRFLVSDAIVAQGIEVQHIIRKNLVQDHPANLFTLF